MISHRRGAKDAEGISFSLRSPRLCGENKDRHAHRRNLFGYYPVTYIRLILAAIPKWNEDGNRGWSDMTLGGPADRGLDVVKAPH